MLTTHFHLVPRSIMVASHLHSPIFYLYITMISEWKKMCRDTAVASFKVLSRYLSCGTEENHERTQSG
jgi:hypothetical protein